MMRPKCLESSEEWMWAYSIAQKRIYRKKIDGYAPAGCVHVADDSFSQKIVSSKKTLTSKAKDHRSIVGAAFPPF